MAQVTEAALETAGGTRWWPDWVFAAQAGYEVGLTADDHCFVMLTADQNDQWRPVYHIPQFIAEHIGRLAATGALKR